MNIVWAFLIIALWDTVTARRFELMNPLDLVVLSAAWAIPFTNRVTKPGRTAAEQMMGMLAWIMLLCILLWFHLRLSVMLSPGAR